MFFLQLGNVNDDWSHEKVHNGVSEWATIDNQKILTQTMNPKLVFVIFFTVAVIVNCQYCHKDDLCDAEVLTVQEKQQKQSIDLEYHPLEEVKTEQEQLHQGQQNLLSENLNQQLQQQEQLQEQQQQNKQQQQEPLQEKHPKHRQGKQPQQHQKHRQEQQDQQDIDVPSGVESINHSAGDDKETKSVIENDAKETQNDGSNMRQKCINLDETTFGKDNSSIFLIEAKGRVGNHLMAYTLIKAFEARLNIKVEWDISSVWPDLEKFRHFGYFLVFGKNLAGYYSKGKLWIYFGKFLMMRPPI